jgi:hypothetical protein
MPEPAYLIGKGVRVGVGSHDNDTVPLNSAQRLKGESDISASLNGSSNQSAATRLAYYQSNTSRLLDFIKQSDQESVDRFISIVRSGASHDDIFAIIDQLSPVDDEQSSKRNGVSN